MNIASAELLQQAFNGLTSSLQHRRAMDAEEAWRRDQLDVSNRKTDVDEAFRKEQLEGQKRMEADASRRADAEERRADAGEQRAGAAQTQQEVAQKQGLLKSVMGLNATGQLTDESRDQVNKWLASDPHLGPTGMQLQAPTNPNKSGALRQGAIVQAVDQIQQYRTQASQTEDPDAADQFNHFADLLEKNLPQSVKSTAPPLTVRPTSTETIDYNAAGHPTKRTTAFALPSSGTPATGSPAAAVAQGPAPDPRDVAFIQANPSAPVLAAFHKKYGPGSSAAFLQAPAQPIVGGGGLPIQTPAWPAQE